MSDSVPDIGQCFSIIDQFDMLPIELAHDLRSPVIREKGEFLGQIHLIHIPSPARLVTSTKRTALRDKTFFFTTDDAKATKKG